MKYISSMGKKSTAGLCRRPWLLLSGLLLLWVAGCGIENFESQTELHPPLGLTASSSNRKVYLHFKAYNDEEFFAGYNVFIGVDGEEIRAQKNSLKNEQTDVYPFYPMSPFDEIREIVIVVSKNTDGNTFQVGSDLFFGVAAYDAQNKQNSKSSNPTNVIVEN